MLILESLWQPSGKDVLGRISPVAVRRERSTNNTAANINVDFDDVVDTDQVFLLHHFTYKATGEVAANTISQLIVVQDIRSGLRVHTIFQDAVITNDFRQNGIGLSPLTVMFGGERLRFNAAFSAVGSAGGHNIDVTFFGILMPRGNWQRE